MTKGISLLWLRMRNLFEMLGTNEIQNFQKQT